MKLYMKILNLFLVVFISLSYGASYAQAFEDKILSVDFISTLVTDALHELSNVADVEIVLDGKTDEELISKSYINVTIDEILLDIFRRKNIVALFRYSDQELVSINLWSLPQAKGSINIIKQQISKNPINSKMRPIAVNSPKRKMFESVNGSKVVANSKLRNNEKNLGDKKKIYVPYASLTKEKSSSSIMEVSENSNEVSSDIEDNGSNDDITAVPEPVQVGGLETPPMPPIMSLYNN